MEPELQVTKLALKFSPPTLVVQYVHDDVTFVKAIKIKTTSKKGARPVVDKLVSTFPDLLGETVVNREQLIELVQRLLDGPVSASPPELGDLNKATDEELEKAKQWMSGAFESNRLKPGDPGYAWDKQVDFAPPVEEDNDWDSEED